jgi:hypothetical protein
MSRREEHQDYKLPIKPMDLPKGKLIYIPISDLELGYEKSLEFAEAVVAYCDVMGFSAKNNKEEIEYTLADFAGALLSTAENYETIRYKVFSDCAFIGAPTEKISELISSVRYAFKQWTFDGIFVRCGMALGSYMEYKSLLPPRKNFDWTFFAGPAVVRAVDCERLGTGSLLYVSNDCATFLADKFKEPIFALEEQKFIGWSDDNYVLYRYLVCSLLRLLRLLANDDYESDVNKRVTSNLLTNINYTTHATNPSLMWGYILAILSLPRLPAKSRERAVKLFHINDPTDFEKAKAFIEDFLKDDEKIKYLIAHAEFDSSIGGSLL